MSCKVLVIPENPRLNGYILKPLVERIMSECGRPRAKVKMLTDPSANGYEHIKGLLPAVVERYYFYDLLLFLPDADGRNRDAEFHALEHMACEKGATLFCCAAQQEVETWLLAGHYDRIEVPWQQIRNDRNVKENVFQDFLRQYSNLRAAGEGRGELMQQGLEQFHGILQRCPELAALVERIRGVCV